ncbi:MAG: hypothetical protein HDT42_02665 [Ruminococcaceae bacterium]|nr:hypothetical protein [Oscillospiraceae bacterium]
MINLLIDSFISQREKMSTRARKYLFLSISLIVVSFVVFLIFITNVNWTWCGVISIITAIAYLGVLAKWENVNRKDVSTRFSNYNNRLDGLRDTLINFQYQKGNENINWYSKNKIQYLIDMCNELVGELSSPKIKYTEFLKLTILPIVSFSAGVLADKASLEISLSIAILAILFVIFIWEIKQLYVFVINFIFKSSSTDELKNLTYALNDLLIRDFGESE